MRLVSPGANGQIDIGALQGRGYVDVAFTVDLVTLPNYKLDVASVTDLAPEFTLGGAGLGSLKLEAGQAPTLLPDPVIPKSGALGKNRYALLDEDLVFDRNAVGQGDLPPYTTTETGGCNASQIADALGLGKSHYENGITKSVLDAWIASAP